MLRCTVSKISKFANGCYFIEVTFWLLTIDGTEVVAVTTRELVRGVGSFPMCQSSPIINQSFRPFYDSSFRLSLYLPTLLHSSSPPPHPTVLRENSSAPWLDYALLLVRIYSRRINSLRCGSYWVSQNSIQVATVKKVQQSHYRPGQA